MQLFTWRAKTLPGFQKTEHLAEKLSCLAYTLGLLLQPFFTQVRVC